jgi:hypothetical protein
VSDGELKRDVEDHNREAWICGLRAKWGIVAAGDDPAVIRWRRLEWETFAEHRSADLCVAGVRYEDRHSLVLPLQAEAQEIREEVESGGRP